MHRKSRLRIPVLIGLVASAVLLLAACDSSDAADDAPGEPTPGVTADPSTGGISDENDDDGDGANSGGGVIEPANPIEPPDGTLQSAGGAVALGLGSYCWFPPEGSGQPGICADAIGIITATDDLPVTGGEALEVVGDLTSPPMHIAFAFLHEAPDSVVEPASPDFRAWQPVAASQELAHDGHTIMLPDDLAPGRYLLAVNYSAGAERSSEATYGALLVVE